MLSRTFLHKTYPEAYPVHGAYAGHSYGAGDGAYTYTYNVLALRKNKKENL